jgi:hypothetical protein
MCDKWLSYFSGQALVFCCKQGISRLWFSFLKLQNWQKQERTIFLKMQYSLKIWKGVRAVRLLRFLRLPLGIVLKEFFSNQALEK